jgi:hypothetical protein
MNGMKSRAKILLLALVASAGWLGGCRGTGTEAASPVAVPTEAAAATPLLGPTPTLGNEPIQATRAPTGGEANPCVHPLWPLNDGAAWVYQLTDEAGSPQIQLVLTVSVAEGRAELAVDGHTSTITCDDGSLVGLPPLPTGHPDLGYYAGGENPRGAFLPEPGLLMPLGTAATWDMEAIPSGTILLPRAVNTQEASITGGRLVIFSQSTGLEAVNVPAGSFSGVAVTQNVFFEIQVTFPDGVGQSALINAQAQQVYAEGVGLVKSVYQGGTISIPNNTWTLPPGPTLELVAFDIAAE